MLGAPVPALKRVYFDSFLYCAARGLRLRAAGPEGDGAAGFSPVLCYSDEKNRARRRVKASTPWL